MIYLKDYKPPTHQVQDVKLTFEIFALDKVEVTGEYQLVGEGGVAFDVGEKMEVLELLVNGEAAEYEMKDGQMIFSSPGREFSVKVKSRINPKENKSLLGLYHSGGSLITQCESMGFRNIVPFFDRPDVMAPYTVTIIGDKQQFPVMLANGNEVAREELDDGREKVTFSDPFNKPSYLFALVAADFEKIEDKFVTMMGREVRLEIYMPEGEQEKCTHAMESLKKALKWDEETFGREYQLDEYQIVVTDDFNFGAMENTGLNIFNTSAVYASPKTATDGDFFWVEGVIAHEFFHYWTGNRVTLRDWFQLTLKEGLTVFRDQEFSSDMNSRSLKRINDARVIQTVQYAQDAGPNAHAIRPEAVETIENFYTATIYQKGAEVIRMIHTMIGPEKFRAGMDLYFERHDGQAVTTDDFVQAMQDASDLDLQQFKESWYRQKGTPVCEVEEEYEGDVYRLKVRQKGAYPESNKPYYFPLSVGLVGPDGQDLYSKILHVSKSEEVFEFEGIKEKPVPSLLRGYSAPVKVHFDYSPEDLRFLMMNDSDPLNRYQAGQRFAKLALDSGDVSDGVLEAFAAVMDYAEKDLALAAMMLILPTVTELAQAKEVYDYHAAYGAREKLARAIAEKYEDRLVGLYEQYHEKGEYKRDKEAVYKRKMKNICLGYLMRLDDKYLSMALEQLASATNMTDEVTALHFVCDKEGAERDAAVAAFYDKWKDERLVFNKWMASQAGSKREDALEAVRNLEGVEQFDNHNPNNLRALYGSFAGNLTKFHSAEGYQFIAEKVLEIDKFNPMVASRMVRAFNDYKKLPEDLKAEMGKVLEGLKEAKISKNLKELVVKIVV